METREQARFDQAQLAAAACAQLLKERYGVRQVHLFGSLAGQSPWHSRSDIDLAVEGLAPERYVRALSELWALLPTGLELDLVTLEDASPEMRARIGSAGINLIPTSSELPVVGLKGEMGMAEEKSEDTRLALREDIHTELVSLGRITHEAKQLLQHLSPAPSFVEIRAAGSIVHDFYSGVEKIFERIVLRLGPGLPMTGSGWHTSLLQSMEIEAEGIRLAVIDHDLAVRLVDYLRFRHLFRHSYGYELRWEKLRPLVEEVEETLASLRRQLEHFVSSSAQPDVPGRLARP